MNKHFKPIITLQPWLNAGAFFVVRFFCFNQIIKLITKPAHMALNVPGKSPYKGDKYAKALQLIDELFPLFPDFDMFRVMNIIRESNLANEEKEIAHYLKYEIEILLIDKLNYAQKFSVSSYSISLTPLGRAVKSSGGHVAFKQRQKEEKEEKDRKEKIDLLTKEWFYKWRYWPYVVSSFALIVSLFSFFRSC